MKPFLLCALVLLVAACGKKESSLSKAQTSSMARLKPYTFEWDAAQPKAVATQTMVLGFPVGSLLGSDGQPLRTGKVRIEVREARNAPAFVRAGLQTKSGDKLLVSDGMFHIVAYQGNTPLSVNPEVGIYASAFSAGKDKDMRLFTGDSAQGTVDWALTDAKEQPFGYAERKCKDCEKLVNLVKKMKPKILKAQDEDPWRAMRYYWRNGTLMFYGSGVIDTIASVNQLKKCEAMLAECGNNAELMAEIVKLQKEIAVREKQDAARASLFFYEHKLSRMGWHNLDKYTQPDEELIVVKGKITDPDGEPIAGPCKFHLVGADVLIHQVHQSEDGSFTFKYMKGKGYKLLAFAGPNLAAQQTVKAEDAASLDNWKTQEVEEAEMEKMIDNM
ncbi:MAG: hypothetical protein KF690_01720 [Bacteroidetes bacterium]|nr:hypothetical protein [Bacteroidota bacterium]